MPSMMLMTRSTLWSPVTRSERLYFGYFLFLSSSCLYRLSTLLSEEQHSGPEDKAIPTD